MENKKEQKLSNYALGLIALGGATLITAWKLHKAYKESQNIAQGRVKNVIPIKKVQK